MIIISEDNLLARVIVAVRLKILGHSEGGQEGKEGRIFLWNTFLLKRI